MFSIYDFRKLCSPLKRLGEIPPSIRCYPTIHNLLFPPKSSLHLKKDLMPKHAPKSCALNLQGIFFFTFNEFFSGFALFFSAANPQFCWKLYFSKLLYFINQIRIVSDPKIPSEFLSIFFNPNSHTSVHFAPTELNFQFLFPPWFRRSFR